jgi:hypothetical protein
MALLQIALGGVALSRSHTLHPLSQMMVSPLLATEVTLVEGGFLHYPLFKMNPSLHCVHPVESQTSQLLPQRTQPVPLG